MPKVGPCEMDKKNKMKQAAGKQAAEWIKEGMLVGLGTGSTTVFFIDALIDRVKAGLKIQAVATSQVSEERAREGGIPIADIQKVTEIHMTVDGADEIDPEKRMIKGGGGALLREKIVASMSHEMVIVVDEAKQVSQLGAFGLPVELIPFAVNSSLHHLHELGFKGRLRTTEQQTLYLTDNGNYIFDISYPKLCSSPEEDHQKLLQVPAVVDTGFFIGLAGRVIVGKDDSRVFLIP